MEKYLKKLELSENLTLQESIGAFEILMNGKANDNEIYNFLTLLSKKGEVSTEIAGGVSVLRNKAKKVNVDDCIDTCGTGGDGKDTLNISTGSALLLSSMGINVAKLISTWSPKILKIKLKKIILDLCLLQIIIAQ